jgi:Tetracyclin repressor-like, C-terminal domain
VEYKHRPDKRAVENADYRRYARQHSRLYRLMTEQPLHRERLAPGAEHRARRPALRAVRDDPDLARALCGFFHGLTILELNDRFPPDADLDAAWEHGLDAFRGGLR